MVKKPYARSFRGPQMTVVFLFPAPDSFPGQSPCSQAWLSPRLLLGHIHMDGYSHMLLFASFSFNPSQICRFFCAVGSL